MKARPLIALALGAPGIAIAQTPASITAEPTHFEIVKLSPGDLLNLRATASPNGMMIGRLPIGAVVSNLGCTEVKKIRWCKVADVYNDKLQGWAAARYLKPTEFDAASAPPPPPPAVGDDETFEEDDGMGFEGTSILPDD